METILQATLKIMEGQFRGAQGQLREAQRCYEDALGMLQHELDALGKDAPTEYGWLLVVISPTSGLCIKRRVIWSGR